MTWEEMTPRERDALVGERAFAYTVDWEFDAPCVKALCDQYDEWGILPHYTADLTAARLVEDEIERRGLQSVYAVHLMTLLCGGWANNEGLYILEEDDLWTLLRATPEQRCRAALRAMGVEV
jgi:hypothetical protein